MSSKKPLDDARVVIGAARQDIKSTLANFQKSVSNQLEELIREADDILDAEVEDEKLEKIQKEVENIKEEVQSHLKPLEKSSAITSWTSEDKGKTAISQSHHESDIQCKWPELDMKLEKILENAAMRYKLSDFHRLGDNLKNCLLCLCIFPQDQNIKKRTLIYWWIGEGIANATQNQSAEEVGEDYFKELLKSNWIDPVNNKSSNVVRECTMDPWVRWLVIFLARKEHFFDMDDTGIPFSSPSKSRRACLLKMSRPLSRLETKSSNLGESKHSSQGSSSRGHQRISLLSVFNVDAEHLNAQDLFLKLKGMKSLVVLQLGRWMTSAKHHIEFVDEDSETLHRVELPERLRYLSLSGISRITELPISVKNLLHLKVLDLRSCQNLEKIGDEIIFLKGLTHLDVSECYMLGHLPNGLGSLSQLEVLKGFMFGSSRSKDPCPLAELTKLKKLKKLSISIGGEAQILPDEMTKLKEISGLRSLAITWGKLSLTLSDDDKKTLEENWTKLSYPPNLEKLDLRCFPNADVWLEPISLGNLKKLYIRGGQVAKLDIHNGTKSDEMMKVEMIRLKFLHKLTGKWSKLQGCFPQLNYLEIHDCPNLQDCPQLDNDEVWIREAIPEQLVSSSMEDSMPIPPLASEPVPAAIVTSEPASAIATTTADVPSHSPEKADSLLPEAPSVHPPTGSGNVPTSSNIGAISSPSTHDHEDTRVPAPITAGTATDAATTVTPSLSRAPSTATVVPSLPPTSVSLPLSEVQSTSPPTTDIPTSANTVAASSTPTHGDSPTPTSTPLTTSTATNAVPAVTSNPLSTEATSTPEVPSLASLINPLSDATTVSPSTTNISTDVNTGVPSSTSPEHGDTPTSAPFVTSTTTDVAPTIIPGLLTTVAITRTEVPSVPPAVSLPTKTNIPSSANTGVGSFTPIHDHGDAPASADLTTNIATDAVPAVIPDPSSTAATTTPEVPSPPTSVIRPLSDTPTVPPPATDIPTNTGVPSSTSSDHGDTPALAPITTSTATDVAATIIPGLLTTVTTTTTEVSSHPPAVSVSLPFSEAAVSSPPMKDIPALSNTSVASSTSSHDHQSTAFVSPDDTPTSSTFLSTSGIDSAPVSIPNLPSTPTNPSVALSPQDPQHAFSSTLSFTQHQDNASIPSNPSPSPSLPPTTNVVVPLVTPEIASRPTTTATSSAHDHERGQAINDILSPTNSVTAILSRNPSAPVLPYTPIDSIIVASSATQHEISPPTTTPAAITDVSEPTVTHNSVNDSIPPNLTSILGAAS